MECYNSAKLCKPWVWIWEIILAVWAQVLTPGACVWAAWGPASSVHQAHSTCMAMSPEHNRLHTRVWPVSGLHGSLGGDCWEQNRYRDSWGLVLIYLYLDWLALACDLGNFPDEIWMLPAPTHTKGGSFFLFFLDLLFIEVTLVYNITYYICVQYCISTLVYTTECSSAKISFPPVTTQLIPLLILPSIPFPSDNHYSAFCIYVFVFVWFVHLFLYSTYEWNRMILVFPHLTYFT